MKPLRLEMEAFGPYKDTTVIDFETLSSAGVYLISGNTGSGKSYIFDGILYALFKTLSGSVRKENSVRCDIADSKTPTRVVFDFEVKGERWHVERSGNLNAKGVYTSKNEFLQGPNGEIYDGFRAVNKKIEEILGLSKEDFITISMIAQGEFRKAMSASTNDRTELFRNIFDTEVYEKIQNELSRRDKELYSIFNTDRSEMLKDIQTVVVQKDSAEEAALHDALENQFISEETITYLQKIGESDEAELGGLRENLKDRENKYAVEVKRLEELKASERLAQEILELESSLVSQQAQCAELEAKRETFDQATLDERKWSSEIDAFQKEIEEHRELDALLREVQDKKRLYDKLVGDSDSIDTALNESKEQLASLEAFVKEHETAEVELTQKNADKQIFEREYTEHKGRISAFEQVDAARRELVSLQETLREQAERKEALEQEIRALEQKISDLDEQIDTDRRELEKKQVVELQIEGVQKDIAACKQAIAEYGQALEVRDKLEAKLPGILKRLEQKILEVQKQQSVADELDRLYLQEQAALLGMKLEDEKPCPVCGSLHHPQIATPSEVCPSEQEVKAARQVKDDLSKEQAAIQTEYEVQKKECESAQKVVDDKSAQIGGIENQEMHLGELEAKLEEAFETLASFDAIAKRLQEAIAGKNACGIELASKTELLNRAVQEIGAIENKSATLQGSLAQQESDLESFDRAEEQAALEQLQSSMKALAGEIETLEAIVSRLKSDRDKIQTVKASIQMSEARKTELETQKHTAHVEYSSKQANYEQRKDKLKGSDATDIMKRIESLKEQIAQSETMRRRTEALYSEVKAAVERNLALVADKRKSLKKIAPGDLKAVEEAVGVLTQEIASCKEALDILTERWAKNKTIIKRIKERFESSEATYKEYQTVKKLSDAANGRISGHKVKFETYLQGHYLDMVLAKANMRFSKMTGGRYSLVRSERTSGQGAAGLDIDIFDAHSNKARASTTLSGGESFKASLSLALGLSDIARMHAGGISVDCMFIDEGFGTLDDESRRSAVETLCELSQGNKSVGIISHVAELKEFIDNQVLVTGDETGSHVELIV